LIYLDTSVALAYIFAEPRVPPASFWENTLVASRLLEYEIWNRLHARTGSDALRKERALRLLHHMVLVELTPTALERALKPFPLPIRTLDALHLATVEYLRRDGADIELASYDSRVLAAAKALDIKIAQL
jgi:predicted nucleic acid-binding protein